MVDVFWLLLEVFGFLFGIVAAMPLLAIYAGCWLRVRFCLHVFRKGFFVVFMYSVPDTVKTLVVLNKEMKRDEAIPYITIKKAKYYLKTEAFFRNGIDPAIAYKEGESNPITIFKTDTNKVPIGFTAEEIRDAFDTKVFQALLRYQFTNLDYAILGILCISTLLSGIGLTYDLTMSNELQQILTALKALLPQPATHTATGIIDYLIFHA